MRQRARGFLGSGLLLVVVAGLLTPAPAAGDTAALVVEPPVEHLDAAGGVLTWVHRGADGRPVVMRALDGRISSAQRVPARSIPGDLGTDRMGRPVLTLRRCDLRGCHWWLYDVRADRARRAPRLGPRGCRIRALSIWQGDLASAADCRRKRASGIYLRSRSRTRRLLGWGPHYGRCCRDGAMLSVRNLDLGRRGLAVGSIDWSIGESEDETGVHFLARQPGGCRVRLASGLSGPSIGATVGPHPRLSGRAIVWWHSGTDASDHNRLQAVDTTAGCRRGPPYPPYVPHAVANGGREFAVDGRTLYVARDAQIVRQTLSAGGSRNEGR